MMMLVIILHPHRVLTSDVFSLDRLWSKTRDAHLGSHRNPKPYDNKKRAKRRSFLALSKALWVCLLHTLLRVRREDETLRGRREDKKQTRERESFYYSLFLFCFIISTASLAFVVVRISLSLTT